MTKRRSARVTASRAFLLVIMAAALAIGLVLVPLTSRGAPEAPAAAGKATGKGAAKKPAPGGKTADAGAVLDGAAAPTAETADAGAPVAKDKDKDTPAKPVEETDLTALPTGKGLPVQVSTAIYFVELKSFDDNKGEVEATVDVRLQWTDLRQRFPKSEATRGYKEYRGRKATEQIEKLWTPEIEPLNRVDTGTPEGQRLRVYTNGEVEIITRTTAKYKVHVEPERFPFDRQKLVVDLVVREATTDEVVLRFDKDDIEWSRVSRRTSLDNWELGLVDLRGDELRGWNGDRYSRVIGRLTIDRTATTSLAPIFIPLVASLLIPLLAVWMNRATDEGFEIPAFELANMGIGGLFSVIALSFAIYSAYGIVAGSDNTVTRLFGLNYVSLALALGIVVVFFRYNLLLRWFGRHVQEQAFRFLAWALPLLSVATSIAFLLVAAA